MPTAEIDDQGIAERVLRREAAKMPGLRKAILNTDDPEAVHDLRVAIRRVRTALRVFDPLLRPGMRRLDTPLHDLFSRLGRVRDFDVAIASLDTTTSTASHQLAARMADARAAAKADLLDLLGARGALDAFARAARRPPLKPGEEIEAGEAIENAHRKARRSLKRLESEWDLAEVHRLRRRLKRLRYTVEFFEPEFDDAAKEYISELKKLQDVIGQEMDRISLVALLSRVDRLSPEADDVRKTIITRLQDEIEAHRGDVRGAKRRIGGKAWRRLHKRLGL